MSELEKCRRASALALAKKDEQIGALNERLQEKVNLMSVTAYESGYEHGKAELQAENEQLREAIKESIKERKQGYEISADLILEDVLNSLNCDQKETA